MYFTQMLKSVEKIRTNKLNAEEQEKQKRKEYIAEMEKKILLNNEENKTMLKVIDRLLSIEKEFCLPCEQFITDNYKVNMTVRNFWYCSCPSFINLNIKYYKYDTEINLNVSDNVIEYYREHDLTVKDEQKELALMSYNLLYQNFMREIKDSIEKYIVENA